MRLDRSSFKGGWVAAWQANMNGGVCHWSRKPLSDRVRGMQFAEDGVFQGGLGRRGA